MWTPTSPLEECLMVHPWHYHVPEKLLQSSSMEARVYCDAQRKAAARFCCLCTTQSPTLLLSRKAVAQRLEYIMADKKAAVRLSEVCPSLCSLFSSAVEKQMLSAHTEVYAYYGFYALCIHL